MTPLALSLVLAAAVAHAAWNIIAHGVSRAGIPFLWCGAVVSSIIWGLVIPFTGGIGDDVAGFFIGVGVSGILHVVYMLVLQRGYREGNLSTVYATARGTGPFLAVIAAVVLLGERPSLLALVGVLAVIVGVVALGLVDRTASAGRRGIDPAILYGLLTGVMIATYTIWDAHAVRTWSINPVAYMVGTCVAEVVVYTVLLRRRRVETIALARMQWRRIIAFAVLSPLSYILVLYAIMIAPVAPLRELSVVLVSLFGAFVLKEPHPARRIVAATVVVAGIALLAL